MIWTPHLWGENLSMKHSLELPDSVDEENWKIQWKPERISGEDNLTNSSVDDTRETLFYIVL